MTNKIALKKEHAEVIERLSMRDSMAFLLKQRVICGEVSEKYQFIYELSIEDLAKILYIPNSYEIEQPKFEENQWVVMKDNRKIIGKTYINEVGYLDVDRGQLTGLAFNSDSWEHATKEEIKVEKERQFWAELNRNVCEFKEGDIFIDMDETPHYIKKEASITDDWIGLKEAVEWYEQKDFKGLYAVETFKEFTNIK